ncbi:calponin homology domain-containing protein DDB_G0272472-like isoform X1 [Megalops cyprinoides]|uniref:calponin homology domain-containing protein DDB_G0272472-like isoform X1 n=1 Tax=Megalops cyprinoides TaxID=118141 RepID=UPI001864C530|nr:calponin homology domain-containing protein DDB_G0272472-like isoform X1 [Megalops cyprinoides]
MSLADQSQQWYPTSVQVTVFQARNLRIKGKNGTNDAYAIMQVAKDKFSTPVAEKCVSPVWKVEASFDLPLFHHGNAERCTLRVLVMHRALVGPDKLLGQAVINLLDLNENKARTKTEWFTLLDKTGKKDKERGEVLLDIQFLRNNMTASMFDLSATEKPRSRMGKLKDKIRGKKDSISDSASAIVPPVSQAMTDSEGEEDGQPSTPGGKKKKSKLKSLFVPKSNLQRNVSQSMSTLGSLPEQNSALSGSRSSGLNIPEGKKKFKFLTHKRTGSSDSKVSHGSKQGVAEQGVAEQSGVCINGSHIYAEGPRVGSTLSLHSSDAGSTEDLHTLPERSEEEQERKRQEEEQERKRQERIRQEEEEQERKRQEELERMRQEELERIRMEEEEQERKRQERIRQEELERMRQEELERMRQEEEEQERKRQERMRQEELERMRQEEEEQERKRQEELERMRQEEDEQERKRQERMRQEELERMRQEEEQERMRQEELERMRQEEEEQERKKQERMRQEELERMRQEELERMRQQEEEQERKRQERMRQEELERMRQEELERMRQEEEEQERKRQERMRQEELEKMRQEEEGQERMRQEEEQERMRQEELEKMRQEEEGQERKKQERMRQEEEQEKNRLEVEQERKRQEELEKMRQEEEQERMRQEELERMRQEEEQERMRQEELERIRMEEEEKERMRQEEEQERKRQEEEQEKKRQEEEQERIRMEEEEEERKRLDKARKDEELRQQEDMKEESIASNPFQENNPFEEACSSNPFEVSISQGVHSPHTPSAVPSSRTAKVSAVKPRLVVPPKAVTNKGSPSSPSADSSPLPPSPPSPCNSSLTLQSGVTPSDPHASQGPARTSKESLTEDSEKLSVTGYPASLAEKKRRAPLPPGPWATAQTKKPPPTPRAHPATPTQTDPPPPPPQRPSVAPRGLSFASARARKGADVSAGESLPPQDRLKSSRKQGGDRGSARNGQKKAGDAPLVTPRRSGSERETADSGSGEGTVAMCTPEPAAYALKTPFDDDSEEDKELKAKEANTDEVKDGVSLGDGVPRDGQPEEELKEACPTAEQPGESESLSQDSEAGTEQTLGGDDLSPGGQKKEERASEEETSADGMGEPLASTEKSSPPSVLVRSESLKTVVSEGERSVDTCLSEDGHSLMGALKKKKRAPLPPGSAGEGKVEGSQDAVVLGQNPTQASDPTVTPPPPKPQRTTVGGKRRAPQPVGVAVSGGRTLLRARVSPSEAQPIAGQSGRAQPITAHSSSSGGGAGGKVGGPASNPRRPHPVRPLESQPAASATVGRDSGPGGVLEVTPGKTKVTEAVGRGAGGGPYSQLTQPELVSLVMRQQTQLSHKDSRIRELEEYIDNLLLRIIEEKPSILQSVSATLKKAV